MEYVIKKINDLCTVTSSKRIYAEQYVKNGIPFYRSKEIIEKNQKQDITDPLFISKDVYENIKEKFGVPQEGDLLLTSVGTLGIPYIVKKETFYFKDGNLTWMNKFKKDVNSIYVFYWLSSQFGKDALINRAIGSSQGAITIDILKKYKILIPNIEIQNKIVKILKKYDDLIENNNQRIKLLENMAEEIYKEWFVRFRFPEYEKEIFIDGTPKGWEKLKVNEVLIEDFNGGWGKDNKEKNYIHEGHVIRGTDIEDIRNSFYNNIPKRFHTENDVFKKQLYENDIILELSNGNINNVGRTLFITKNILKHFINIMSASFCKTIRCKNKKYAMALYYAILYLQNSNLLSFYKNTGTNGINNFNYKRFLKQNIIVPPEEMLDKINDIYILAEKYRQGNENLMTQRDLLLPRLMSGKIDLTDKEIV